MLPKAPNVIISSSLFALSGYSLFLNFDPDNDDPAASDTRGVGIFVSIQLQATQVYFNTSNFKDQVWASIKL